MKILLEMLDFHGRTGRGGDARILTAVQAIADIKDILTMRCKNGAAHRRCRAQGRFCKKLGEQIKPTTVVRWGPDHGFRLHGIKC